MKTNAFSRALLYLGVLALFAAPAMRAGTIWIDWTSSSPNPSNGNPGSATGVIGGLGGVLVNYSGQVTSNTVTDGTSTAWSNPASSFIGGTSTTSPSTIGDVITLTGQPYAGPNTLTFASPITNPLIAIWSLGQPGTAASFTFTAVDSNTSLNVNPTYEAGGPDIYGGAAITVIGNTVSGNEGSGVVQFTGTFTSISWTDTYESYYGFTLGANGVNSTATPEPATLTMFGAGMGALALLRRRQRSC